jgi:predicted nucleotidyltransferase component of viral defense system
MADAGQALPHEAPREFSEALTHTASETGFNARLIEKDYFCSIVLRDLKPLFEQGLVFKGGTSLSKVYAGFHRLSEDLDFAISMAQTATQSIRRETINETKTHVQLMLKRLPWIREIQPLTGANRSTQYNGIYAYTSHISGERDTIKIEIGLREPIVESVETRLAQTILIDPFSSRPALVPVPVAVISARESYAEKLRAALSRREPAIRDLFDLQHAIGAGILDMNDPALLELAKGKLKVNPDEPVDVSDARFDAFRRQVEAMLRPVLRPRDFVRFDVERAFVMLREVNERLHRAD